MRRSRVELVIGSVGIVITVIAIIVVIAQLVVLLQPPAQGRVLLAEPTPIPRELFEPVTSAGATPAQDTSKRVEQPKPAQTPSPTPVVALRRSTGVRGTATWYCDPPAWPRCTKGSPAGCYCAAAGPELRAALGDWRGRMVMVTNADASAGVWVKLVDWCACGGDHVIDLYHAAFLALGGNGTNAEVSW